MIAIFTGQTKFEAVNINPNAKNYLKVVESRNFPKDRKQRGLNEIWGDKDDFVTSLQFDENNGIIVTFFCGYFKMYEPITWTEVWNKDVNKKVTKSTKEKKGKEGEDNDT